MMAVLYLSILASLITLGLCGKYTVTDEVWFEVEIRDLEGPGDHYTGTFTVGVFGEVVPMTALNFVSIARGYKQHDEMMSYRDTRVHRIVRDLVIQAGDITTGDGTGGKSIFGHRFNDENFELSHRSAGWVAMANHGPDTNNSQFYVLLGKARWLDGKHVVFGKVVRGWDVIQMIGEVPAEQDTAIPEKSVKIVDCGVHSLKNKYTLTTDQLDSTQDIKQ